MGRPSRLTYLTKSAGHPSRQSGQIRQAQCAEKDGLCGQVSQAGLTGRVGHACQAGQASLEYFE